jgi:hypothetical protein
MKALLLGCLAALLAAGNVLAQADDAKSQQSTTTTATVRAVAFQAEKAPPPIPVGGPVITLYERHGHVTPQRHGFNHTGAGNIDIAQPAPDVVIVTMTGVAVAGPHPCKDSVASLDFDLEQCFDIALEKAAGRKLKLAVEARVIGLLRSSSCGKGVAEESGGCATIAVGPVAVVTVCAPAHAVSGGDNLSINDHEGPVSVPISPGKYTLHQAFHIAVSNPHGFRGKAASAEFAPDPALDPLWISYWEPFHGANKKDFGLQVVLRVTAE